ncbi:MAG TPA: hypothetical protein VE961_07500 [Pyrinomonadaceae bacterium]|nr:hypothetical protein [Pyrinomonadaceae bacterium]
MRAYLPGLVDDQEPAGGVRNSMIRSTPEACVPGLQLSHFSGCSCLNVRAVIGAGMEKIKA